MVSLSWILVTILEHHSFLGVSLNQVFHRQVNLLVPNTHLDLCLVSVHVRAATNVTLELSSDNNDFLVEQFVFLDPVLVDRSSLSDEVRASLLLFNDLITLDAHILAILNKDTIGSAHELSTPEEELVSHHILYNSFLLIEVAPPVYDFNRVINGDDDAFAITQELGLVHWNLLVNFIEA